MRRGHLRTGVLLLGATLAAGFVLVELGLVKAVGWLLVIPLAFGTYSLLAGVFGVCVLAGVYGKRRADHGPEAVPDARLRRQLVQRGVWLAALSCCLSVLATTAFLVSG